ncbi:MAG: hypothetical protein AAFX05_15170, partial [Planctomycetota bacterium]
MRFRADVAGYIDRAPHGSDVNHLHQQSQQELPFGDRGPRPACEPRTVIIECKQSRGDFLRDQRNLERLIRLRQRLDEQRSHFEEQHIKRAEPHLRRSGEFLFGQMEQWNFHETRSSEYRRIVQRLERVEQRVHGETKLFRIARYRLADRLYILAPRGMIRPSELPPGWGLLECPARWRDYSRQPLQELSETPIHLARPAADGGAAPRQRSRLLRNIAVASTMAIVRQDGASRPLVARATKTA